MQPVAAAHAAVPGTGRLGPAPAADRLGSWAEARVASGKASSTPRWKSGRLRTLVMYVLSAGLSLCGAQPTRQLETGDKLDPVTTAQGPCSSRAQWAVNMQLLLQGLFCYACQYWALQGAHLGVRAQRGHQDDVCQAETTCEEVLRRSQAGCQVLACALYSGLTAGLQCRPQLSLLPVQPGV